MCGCLIRGREDDAPPAAPPDERIRISHECVCVPEALELAHRQAGLRWAAPAGLIDPSAPTSVGPIVIDEHIALSELLDKVADALGTTWHWKRQVAVFGRIDRAAVRGVGRKLASSWAKDRLAAVAQLRGMGPGAVTTLTAACRDLEDDVRRAAFAALADMERDCLRYSPPGRVPLMAAMFDDPPDIRLTDDPPDSEAWRAAVTVLGAARVLDADRAIRQSATKAGPPGRAIAAWALGQLGPDLPARDALLSSWMADPQESPPVRLAAAMALASADSRAALLEASDSPLPAVRLTAVESLGWMASDAITIKRLAARVSDESPAVALASADALGRLGSEAAARALADLLIAPTAPVRWRAADGLGQTCLPISREVLTLSLPDADAPLRTICADAIGRLGGGPVADVADRLARDESAAVRTAAMVALGRLGSAQSRDVLDTVLFDAGAPIIDRMAAVEGLGLSRHPKARPMLRQVAQEDKGELSVQACRAMARLGKSRFATSQPAATQPGLELLAAPPMTSTAELAMEASVHRRMDGTVLLWWSPPQPLDVSGYLVFRADAEPGLPHRGPMLRATTWPISGNAWIERESDGQGAARMYVIVPLDARGGLMKGTVARSIDGAGN